MSSPVENQAVELRESAREGDPYRVVAWWSSGKAGSVTSESGANAIPFTAPPRFGGTEGTWTPEDLMLGAIASCYTTTFCALAEYSKLKYLNLAVEVRGTLRQADRGYSFGEISICAKLILGDGQEQQRALRLLQKAAAACLVSRLLAVEPAFQPQVRILRPQGAAAYADATHSGGAV
jgi:organic hydroperoxide reductase OsmC/OhrA